MDRIPEEGGSGERREGLAGAGVEEMAEHGLCERQPDSVAALHARLACEPHGERLARGEGAVQVALAAELLGDGDGKRDIALVREADMLRPDAELHGGPGASARRINRDFHLAAAIEGDGDAGGATAAIFPFRKFMRGLPMKPATKRLAGRL